MWAIFRSKLFCFANIVLIGAIFIIAYMGNSYFEIACAACAAVYWLVQLRLSFIMDKEDAAQKKLCKPIGYLLLIPALGIIIIGVLYYFSFLSVSVDAPYIIVVISGVLSVCLILQMIAAWNNKTPAGKFYRYTLSAALSVPMSLIIVLIMQITSPDSAAALGLMSVVVFGSMAVLFAANMILVSICSYKGTADSIRTMRSIMKSNKLVFTRASIFKDTFLVAAKSIISVISLSFFMFVNALYSAGMGIARYIAIKMHKQDRPTQIKNYRYVGIIISIASICYVLYSIRLFFGGKTGVYDMNVALVIALYTFVEFGINIREAIRLHKSKALEAKALRAIGLSSTLLCFVLTQTAIMSFAAEGDNSFSNALSGVVFGGLASLVGLYVIIDSFRHQKELLVE